MKALARRFEVEENAGPGRGIVRLRLLPHPIHRYTDMPSGIQDGAIFSFGVYGTNPDVLLQIEARREAGSDASWFFSFARHCGGAPTARLDGSEVWSLGPAQIPANLETYTNRRLAEDATP